MMMIMMRMRMMRMILATTATIVALKGAVRDFLQSPHCAANCLQQERSSGLGAIVCKSRATHRGPHHVQHVVCHVVRRGSSAIKFGRAELAFICALFYWLIGLTDEEGKGRGEGGGTGVPGENP